MRPLKLFKMRRSLVITGIAVGHFYDFALFVVAVYDARPSTYILSQCEAPGML